MRNPGDPDISQWNEYFGYKCQTQGLRNEYQEVGVSHSSVEAGNDRGAKGWQTDRT
ncbi:hypothetical protein [Photorhabdus sp. RM96S]|uniref:hypothetical protein n=1 Tax=Photorhabdus sp. RM96S TaxID=3342822 RepID=UPI0036DDDB85